MHWKEIKVVKVASIKSSSKTRTYRNRSEWILKSGHDFDSLIEFSKPHHHIRTYIVNTIQCVAKFLLASISLSDVYTMRCTKPTKIKSSEHTFFCMCCDRNHQNKTRNTNFDISHSTLSIHTAASEISTIMRFRCMHWSVHLMPTAT